MTGRERAAGLKTAGMESALLQFMIPLVLSGWPFSSFTL